VDQAERGERSDALAEAGEPEAEDAEAEYGEPDRLGSTAQEEDTGTGEEGSGD
jgi:hypothetical protein